MHVASIYISPDKGLPMQSVDRAYAMFAKGLDQDRYAAGKGAYSNSARKVARDVSLISQAQLALGNSRLTIPFPMELTRRNILVDTGDFDLNGLVGHLFQVGPVWLEGVELCDPCARPSAITKIPGFETAFVNCGGIRAKVISSGYISIGDGLFFN